MQLTKSIAMFAALLVAASSIAAAAPLQADYAYHGHHYRYHYHGHYYNHFKHENGHDRYY